MESNRTCAEITGVSSSLHSPDHPKPVDLHECAVWPASKLSRNSFTILQPLSFPEPPKEDLSLFTDPSKDQPIYCLICERIFSSSGSNDKRSHCITGPTTTEKKKSDANVGLSLTVDSLHQEIVSEEKEESGKRRDKNSRVLNLPPKDEWLRHMLLEHKIVIHRVSEIFSLKWYNNYVKLGTLS